MKLLSLLSLFFFIFLSSVSWGQEVKMQKIQPRYMKNGASSERLPARQFYKNPSKFIFPDLTVESVTTSYTHATTDNFGVTINSVIKNLGSLRARAIKVLVEYKDMNHPELGWQFFGQAGISELAPYQSSEPVSISRGLRLGLYKIRVTVDAPNYIRESNESNNERTVGLSLGP